MVTHLNCIVLHHVALAILLHVWVEATMVFPIAHVLLFLCILCHALHYPPQSLLQIVINPLSLILVSYKKFLIHIVVYKHLLWSMRYLLPHILFRLIQGFWIDLLNIEKQSILMVVLSRPLLLYTQLFSIYSVTYFVEHVFYKQESILHTSSSCAVEVCRSNEELNNAFCVSSAMSIHSLMELVARWVWIMNMSAGYHQ